MTLVKFCISLRVYNEVTLAAKYAIAYTLYFRHNRKLILTAIPLAMKRIPPTWPNYSLKLSRFRLIGTKILNRLIGNTYELKHAE